MARHDRERPPASPCRRRSRRRATLPARASARRSRPLRRRRAADDARGHAFDSLRYATRVPRLPRYFEFDPAPPGSTPTMRPSSMRMMRLANGIIRGSCATTNTPRAGFFGDLRQHLHDGLSVGAVQRRGRLVREDGRRVSHDGARDRDALLLAAAELAGIGFDLVGEADGRHRLLCLGFRQPSRRRRARPGPGGHCPRPSASETDGRIGRRTRCARA